MPSTLFSLIFFKNLLLLPVFCSLRSRKLQKRSHKLLIEDSMNDLARSSQFISNSLKVYDIIHFQTFSKFFSFLFVNLQPISIIERSHPISWISNNDISSDIMSSLMFCLLDRMRFHKRFLRGQFLCLFFSSFSTIA